MATLAIPTQEILMQLDPAPQPVRILSISPAVEDHRALNRMLNGPRWNISTANSCLDAMVELAKGPVEIAICERDLPDGDWRDMLRCLGGCPEPPSLIVTSRVADGFLWAEVLNLGGFDVLAKPFDGNEVGRVVDSAARHRRKPSSRAWASGA